MSSWVSDATASRTFFDQGLFLLHLNRGKEEMRRGQYDSARREFTAAQQFRPHDPDVVSNLSFSLFHLGQYEDAERITRELLASHADSVPLLFNLGLILFKTERHEEAQVPLRRVIELVPQHRKAHLTLGLIAQREGDLPEARRRFQLAGAELKEGATGDDTVARSARTAVASVASVAATKSYQEIETSPIVLVKPEPLTKSSDKLPVAEADIQASAQRVVDAVTELKPEAAAPALLNPLPSQDSELPDRNRTPLSKASGAFRPEVGGFVSANCAQGLFVRRGVISGRDGSPHFEKSVALAGSLNELLVRASGEGTLLLVDRGRRPFLKPLTDEFLSIEPSRLLAFEASLHFREDPAFEFRRHIATPFLKLFGTGVVAMGVTSEPAIFEVVPERPLTLAARSVVAYGGEIAPDLLEESDPMAQLGSGPVMRFVGSGYVLADAS